MTESDTIPLSEGELSGQVLTPERPGLKAIRGRRSSSRHNCDNVHVCYSPTYKSGRVEHVECRVIDVSAAGISIEFDGPLEAGLLGRVSFRTEACRSVRVACKVCTCSELEDGLFAVGLQFSRRLQRPELRLAKRRAGREVAPGLRPRRLRVPVDSAAAD